MKEQRIPGMCECGRRVIKVLHSEVSTWLRDGTRYAYPETIDSERWCIFRCERCHAPIMDSWRAEVSQ